MSGIGSVLRLHVERNIVSSIMFQREAEPGNSIAAQLANIFRLNPQLLKAFLKKMCHCVIFSFHLIFTLCPFKILLSIANYLRN